MKSRQAGRLFGGAVAWLAIAAAVPALAAAGSISGTVSSDSGAVPIQGVYVCAIPEPETYVEDGCEETDPAGRYRIADLPGGAYRIRFGAEFQNLRYVSEWYDNGILRDADLLHLGALQDATVDAGLAEGGSIAGTVTDETNGQPIANLSACAIDWDIDQYRCARSNANGEYVINGLPSSEYRVEYEGQNEANYLREYYKDASSSGSATKVPVTPPATTSGIDAQLAPGAQILGRVTESRSGGPFEGAMVCAFVEEGWEGRPEQANCDWSDPGGNYALRGLPAGTYLVAFEPESIPVLPGTWAEQWWQGADSIEQATPITIAPPETRTGIDGAIESPYWPRPQQPLPPEEPLSRPPVVQKPLPKCKKGFRRKLVKGKRRCVRKHKRHHGKAKQRRGAKSKSGPAKRS